MKSERDYFADEIAIDFPSVGHLVARVREAFLGESEGERARPLGRKLWLSREEAERGAVVPLDVLVRGTCQCCGGRGETWAEPCAPCDGTGDVIVVRRLTINVPPRVKDGARLPLLVDSPYAPAMRVHVRVAIRSDRPAGHS